MPAAHDLAVAILDEPCPCDDCTQRQHCASSGDACKAFAAYVKCEPWRQIVDREPSRARGKALGIG